MGVFLDASALIDALEGDDEVLTKIQHLEADGKRLRIPAPALHEVEVGIRAGQGPGRARAFRGLMAPYEVVAFDAEAARESADLQAELLAAGARSGAVDVMVAGMAVAGGGRVLASDQDFAAMAEVCGVPLEPL